MDAGVKNVEELRNFAGYLHWLSESMIEEFSRARSQMIALNENWTDIENERFMEVFTESVNHLNKISELMESHSNYLMKKCEILDMYLNA